MIKERCIGISSDAYLLARQTAVQTKRTLVQTVSEIVANANLEPIKTTLKENTAKRNIVRITHDAWIALKQMQIALAQKGISSTMQNLLSFLIRTQLSQKNEANI